MADEELNPEGISIVESEEQEDLITLGGMLRAKFEEYRDARNDVESDWIEDLRSFMGQYDPEVLAKIEQKGDRSQVYVGLTRTKVLAAYSRITDLLFQAGQKFFAIEETPVAKQPLLEMQLAERAAQEIMVVSQQVSTEELEPLIEMRIQELKEQLKEETEKRVEAMSEQILDQAVENNLEGKMKEAIMEQVIFGTGAMKAGTLKINKDHKWIKGENGFAVLIEEEPMPEMEAVSVFDLYPDPYATSVEDMRNIFRRHIISRQELTDLKDFPNFNIEAIDECLFYYKEGNHYEMEENFL